MRLLVRHVTRGDMSMLLKDGHLYALNHKKKTVQDLFSPAGPELDAQIDDALDYLLAHDVCSHRPYRWTDAKTAPKFVRSSKWFGGGGKCETIDGVETRVYKTQGMRFHSVIRSDPHAKKTRIPRKPVEASVIAAERELFDLYFKGAVYAATDSEPEEDGEELSDEEAAVDDDGNFSRPDYLALRWRSGLVWESEKVHRMTRSFDGKTCMASDFPLSLSALRPICAAFAAGMPGFSYLQNIISLPSIPEGFPLKLEVPIFFPVTAVAQVQNVKESINVPEGFFDVPAGYKNIEENYLGFETREMLKGAKRTHTNSE